MAFAIRKHPDAFALGAPKAIKRPRAQEKAHISWIKTLPCIITGTMPVDPAHISYADPSYGKRERGKSEKADDNWIVPLTRILHDEQHGMNEREFWARHCIDPLKVALSLWLNSGDDDMAHIILREARALAASTRPIAGEQT